MSYLLITDLHLDDSPINDYRWDIFEVLHKLCKKHKVRRVYVLGDFVDRKDRHSAELVNRIVEYLSALRNSNIQVIILAGNHDAPVTGQPFWEFLIFADIHYITTPSKQDGVWLLPWSGNPVEQWKSLDLTDVKAILMHQTVSGAIVENDRRLEDGSPMPVLPRGIPMFSGDVHRPQRVGGLTYVGAPYPVRFSESWANRALLIEGDDWRNPIEIPLNIIKRSIVDLTELPRNFDAYQIGDQIKIRYHLSASELRHWPEIEQALRHLAHGCCEIVSLEPVVERELFEESERGDLIALMDPAEILAKFAQREGMTTEAQDLGINLLREARR